MSGGGSDFWVKLLSKVDCVVDRWLPRRNFHPSPRAGVPSWRPSRRGRRGVAGASIGLENAPAHFGARRCEPILAPGPQNAMGSAMGGAGGDALSIKKICSCIFNIC
jgi:hypothetical protein